MVTGSATPLSLHDCFRVELSGQDPNLDRQLADAKARAKKWYAERGLPTPEEVDKAAVEAGFRRFVHQKQRSSRNQAKYRLTHTEQKEREKARRKTEAYKKAHREAVKRYKLRHKFG